jgi:hypothetical protein
MRDPNLPEAGGGTVSKVLATHPLRAHKLEYSPERRDSGFGVKMMEILPVYLEVSVRRTNHPRSEPGGMDASAQAIVPPGGTEYHNRADTKRLNNSVHYRRYRNS